MVDKARWRHWLAVGMAFLASCQWCASDKRGPIGSALSGDASVGPVPDIKPLALARLVAVRNDVTLERAGKKELAEFGPLYIGDALEAGEDSEARIQFVDGRTIILEAMGRVELAQDGGVIVLHLVRGVARAAARRSGEAQEGTLQLRIDTPYGLVRMSDSESNVRVQVDGILKHADVDVTLGQVDVENTDGAVERVASGRSVRLRVGEVDIARLAVDAGATTRIGIGIGTPDVEPRPDVEPLPSPSPGPERTLPSLQIALMPSSGRVETKKSGSPNWQLASRRSQVRLTVGDAVRVRDGNGVLKVEESDTTYTLSNGSEVVLAQASRDDGAEVAVFDVKRGTVVAKMAGGAQRRLGLGPATLTTNDGGHLTVIRTSRGFDVAAVTGAFTLQHVSGKTIEVPGGSVATVSNDEVTVSVVPKEPLALPAHSGMRVFQSKPGRVALTWDGADDRPYRVDVANDAAFTSMVITGQLRQRYLNVNTPSRGAIFWRVFDGEQLVDKGSALFAPESRSRDLERTRNEVTDGADKTTIYYQDKPPAVTFSYEATEGATRYRTTVFREGDLGTPVAETTVKDLKVALPAGTLGEGSYLWSVSPLSADGEALVGGKMNKLEIAYDNAVPDLVIQSPKNGDAMANSVVAAGVAPIGAKVYVNGTLMELDAGSRFRATVAPVRGAVVFRMVNGANEVYTVRSLAGK